MKYLVFILLLVAAYQATQSWMYNYTNGIEAQTIVDQYTADLQFATTDYWQIENKIGDAKWDIHHSEANLHHLDIVLLCIAFGIIICWVNIIQSFWHDYVLGRQYIKILKARCKKKSKLQFKPLL